MSGANVEQPRYALVTPAYNEEALIEGTIRSVVSQTVLPARWVIVSDGSTDRTDELVAAQAKHYPFLQLIRLERAKGHSFASKVFAFRRGLEALSDVPYDFLGNLDGDVSFGEDYFADLLQKFSQDPRLGVAGGGIYEWNGTAFALRKGHSDSDVAGAVQMFRRSCFEATGGFLPLEYGGEDWCIQLMSRMNDWRVRSFTELEVRHHRPTGSTAGVLRYWSRQGMMDYGFGSHPLFEMIRLAKRIPSYPPVVGAAARLTGYLSGYLSGKPRLVPAQVTEYLRREEKERLWRVGQRALGVAPRKSVHP